MYTYGDSLKSPPLHRRLQCNLSFFRSGAAQACARASARAISSVTDDDDDIDDDASPLCPDRYL